MQQTRNERIAELERQVEELRAQLVAVAAFASLALRESKNSDVAMERAVEATGHIFSFVWPDASAAQQKPAADLGTYMRAVAADDSELRLSALLARKP